MNLQNTIQLNNKKSIPRLGLGVYMAGAGQETQKAIQWALEVGYRHIDTAAVYGNEQDVGRAIQDCGIPREEIFITTKLWNADHGYKKTLAACQKSLDRLGTSIDLYLIHWPVQGLRNETWKALELLVHENKCQSIGVSNYTVSHLQELLSICEIPPAINQVEFSPYLYQHELLAFCQQHHIQLEAYSPLTRGYKFGDSRLVHMASKYEKTLAQILIRWALQHNLVVIPKSVKRERILENAFVFDFVLSPEDMNQLNALHENFRTCWDPTHIV